MEEGRYRGEDGEGDEEDRPEVVVVLEEVLVGDIAAEEAGTPPRMVSTLPLRCVCVACVTVGQVRVESNARALT